MKKEHGQPWRKLDPPDEIQVCLECTLDDCVPDHRHCELFGIASKHDYDLLVRILWWKVENETKRRREAEKQLKLLQSNIAKMATDHFVMLQKRLVPTQKENIAPAFITIQKEPTSTKGKN